jgi:hypothetical protein
LARASHSFNCFRVTVRCVAEAIALINRPEEFTPWLRRGTSTPPTLAHRPDFPGVREQTTAKGALEVGAPAQTAMNSR